MKALRIVLAILLGVLNYSANAAWPASYGGISNSYDIPVAIATDAFGNVYVTGATGNGTNQDFTTIKFDPNGSQQWVARYDGPNHGDDYPVGICVDPNGGAIVTGNSEFDIVTVKYDATGQQLWVRRYDGGYDGAEAIIANGNGMVFVAGSSEAILWVSDWVILCYAPDGRTLWTNFLRGTHSEWYPNALALDNADGIYVVGTGSIDDPERTEAVGVLRCRGDGVSLWTNWIAGADSGAIATDRLGNAYVAVYSQIAKFSPEGRPIWITNYAGSAHAIVVDKAGSCIVAGPSGGANVYLAKYDSAGSLLWSQVDWYGLEVAYLSGLAIDSAGYTHLSGDGQWYGSQIHYEAFVARYDSAGRQTLSTRFGGMWPDNSPPKAISVDLAGNAFVIGQAGYTSTDIVIDRYLQQPFAPELTWTRDGENVTLAWPLIATNVVLESASDISPSAEWSTITNAPAILGWMNVLSNATGTASQFYRLRGW